MHTIPPITHTALALRSENRSVTLITSPRAYDAAEDSLSGMQIVQKQFVSTSDMKAARGMLTHLKPTEVVYAIGGGQVADIGRYIGADWNVPVICVPTVISSDAFLVDCTGLRKDGGVTYVPTTMASEVLIDWDILMKTDTSLHLTGCGDVLSIYTGLHDWLSANKSGNAQPDETYDEPVATMAAGILEALLQSADELRARSREGLTSLIRCLAMEVALCNLYGNSRPEEGGEHFFAYCIESKLPHFMHGEIVSFGVMLTAFLQGQDWQRIQKFLDITGLQYRPKGLTKTTVINTLQELPDYVIKHNLRWSIYNDFKYLKRQGDIEAFLKTIRIS